MLDCATGVLPEQQSSVLLEQQSLQHRRLYNTSDVDMMQPI